MRSIIVVLCSSLVLAAAHPSAQRNSRPSRSPEQIRASYEVHKHDFDYLLGDWEIATTSKEFGKARGFWSAVRLAQGQILDEYRLVGDNGETFYVTTTVRSYNAVADRWELIGMDQSNGLRDFGTAQRVGSEMRITQRFGVAGGNPVTMRIRYYDIQPDRFSWTADQSKNGGRTWVKDYLQIEARRVGPLRSMGPLAPARK